MKNLIATVLCLASLTCFSQKVEKRQITAAQIDSIFSRWDTSDKAGIATGILSDGKIIYTKGYGLANLEHKIPISPETRFHIGDLAKEFTVYALLLLEQRNQLSLEDDIRKHIPKLAALPHAITINQLMHHTSGLNNDVVAKALAGWGSEDGFTKAQAFKMVLNQTNSISKSGSEQRPSNAGFMILEDLIATIGKTTYADFITKEIFLPLGMTHSVYDTEGVVIPNKAQGYVAHKDGFANATMNHTHNILTDLYTTVTDMCLWAKELGNPKIGTAQMIQKFDRLSVVNEQKVAEENMALYTGGHRFWDYRGTKKLYHIEVAGGYASKLIRYPAYDLAIVVMGNDGAYNGDAATAASELYIEDLLDPMSSRERPEIKAKKLSTKALSVFEGNYWDIDSYATRKIHLVNDTLRYFRSPGNESALVPLSENSFKMITWGEVTVSFDVARSSNKMTVTVGDDTYHLEAFDVNADWTKNLNAFTGGYDAADLDTSYTIIEEEGKLILSHPRLEQVTLDPRIPDVFAGDRPHFTALKFKRDSSGHIVGFHLATSGVADIWFQKELVHDKLSQGE